MERGEKHSRRKLAAGVEAATPWGHTWPCPRTAGRGRKKEGETIKNAVDEALS